MKTFKIIYCYEFLVSIFIVVKEYVLHISSFGGGAERGSFDSFIVTYIKLVLGNIQIIHEKKVNSKNL